MTDVKEIRRKLWNSLDMDCVRNWLVTILIAVAAVVLIFALRFWNAGKENVIVLTMTMAVGFLPIVIFYLWRTFRIFQKPEAYTFCQTVLSQPKGGSIRDTIKFTVLLEDADGAKFVADTHSIFFTHGIVGPLMENYVNQTVEVAYNEETDMVVVIG